MSTIAHNTYAVERGAVEQEHVAVHRGTNRHNQPVFIDRQACMHGIAQCSERACAQHGLLPLRPILCGSFYHTSALCALTQHCLWTEPALLRSSQLFTSDAPITACATTKPFIPLYLTHTQYHKFCTIPAEASFVLVLGCLLFDLMYSLLSC
jgi:hypothetical protein